MSVRVRVFTDNQLSFAMTEELQMALKGSEFEKDLMKDIFTIPGAAVKCLVDRSDMAIDIETIPIVRDNYEAEMIATPSGNECKLAVDVLFELILNVSSGLAVNIPTKEVEEQMNRFVDKVEEYFPADKKSPFFMTKQKIDMLNQIAQDSFKAFRNQKVAGNWRAKQKVFGKFEQMLDKAAEYMLICFMESRPSLTRFVHNQNGCYRLALTNCCPKGAAMSPMDYVLNGMGNLMIDKYMAAKDDSVATSTSTSSDSEVVAAESVAVVSKKRKNKKRKVAKKVEKVAEESEDVTEESDDVQEASEVSEPEDLKVQEPESEAQKELPKSPKSDVPCQKCFRTSIRCNEAKDQLKESQSTMKRLERKLSAAELEVEELKRKMVQMEKTFQEKLQLQEKTHREEVEGLRAEVVQLKTPKIIVPAPEPIRSQNYTLEQLQDKLAQVETENPLEEASQKLSTLMTLSNDSQVKDQAELELVKLKIDYEQYKETLESSIRIMVLENTPSQQLPVLPDYPTVPKMFDDEIQKAREAKNKELEGECTICTWPMDGERFECPVCRMGCHVECIDRWWKKSKICPNCRTQWK